jgi:hypothetical protein
MSVEVKVVESSYKPDFEEALQEWLDVGWELYGNMVISIEPKEDHKGKTTYTKRYSQMMVRDNKEG